MIGAYRRIADRFTGRKTQRLQVMRAFDAISQTGWSAFHDVDA